MNVRRNLGGKLAKYLEVPVDIVQDLARLTLVGGMELTLENHRGIVQFSPHRLRFALPQGELIIGGENLVLISLAPEEAVIQGQIMTLELA